MNTQSLRSAPGPYETDSTVIAKWLLSLDITYDSADKDLLRQTVEKQFTFCPVSVEDRYEIKCLYWQAVGYLRWA